MKSELVFDMYRIKSAIKEIALNLNQKYPNQEVTLIGILNGCIPFLTDISRALKFNCYIETMRIMSYDGENQMSPVLMTTLNPKPITDKNVVLIDDICDTGKTFKFAEKEILKLNPKSISWCSLVRRSDDCTDKLIRGSLLCGEGFLFGYGMDLDGLHRNLDQIYKIS